jgi:hypothetical protein
MSALVPYGESARGGALLLVDDHQAGWAATRYAAMGSLDRSSALLRRPKTRWARNLAANPNASIHLESGSDVVIAEGIVDDLITDVDLGAAVVNAWNRKYGRLSPNPAESGIFRFRPDIARAWSTETLEDGTRWRFPVRKPSQRTVEDASGAGPTSRAGFST